MPKPTPTPRLPRSYHYTRDRDGCDDTWVIHGPRSRSLVSIRFWDEPDTQDWVARAEAQAKLIVAALNAFHALPRTAKRKALAAAAKARR